MRCLYKIDRSLVIDAKPVSKEAVVIIKKEELEPKIDIEKIQRDAEEIIIAAKENAVQIEKSAYDKGYEEGYGIGHKEGEQNAKTSFQAMVDEGQSIIVQSHAEREKMILEAEEAVVNLALDIAKKIILIEIDKGSVFINMVKHALGKLATANKAMLSLNPEEYQTYFPDGVGEIVTNGGIITFTVEANASLPKGSCTIETEDGTIKAGVDEQIARIRETLLPVAVNE